MHGRNLYNPSEGRKNIPAHMRPNAVPVNNDDKLRPTHAYMSPYEKTQHMHAVQGALEKPSKARDSHFALMGHMADLNNDRNYYRQEYYADSGNKYKYESKIEKLSLHIDALPDKFARYAQARIDHAIANIKAGSDPLAQLDALGAMMTQPALVMLLRYIDKRAQSEQTELLPRPKRVYRNGKWEDMDAVKTEVATVPADDTAATVEAALAVQHGA